MQIQTLLAQIRETYQAILQQKLTGIYIHGSLAFGCFHWECSDIDFLVVVNTALTQTEKESLIRCLLQLDASAPPKGFEMSVVLEEACRTPVWPVSYELHYSRRHKPYYQADLSGHCRVCNGTDPDLAAHFAVIRAAGYALCGNPIENVFAPVPRHAYLRSLLPDLQSAAADIEQAPIYAILNLCRSLAYVKEGTILSKQQGGDWALQHLPAYWHPLIRSALAQYRGEPVQYSSSQLQDFAQETLTRINAALPRCPWCNPGNQIYVNYHDQEWGVPEHDDGKLFELLILESFQAGLSWECILNKREAFRRAFDGFDASIIRTYGEVKIEELMQDRSIVRNRRKITSTIQNAAVFQQIQAEYGSFDHYIWAFTNGQTIHECGRTTSALSDQVSDELRKRGMRFVGSTIVYSYLQAIGIIHSHEPGCWLGETY